MKYYVEERLCNFRFWSEAAKIAKQLTEEQFEQLEAIMDDGVTEWTDTEINDLFWFEPDTIAEWLGYKDWEHLANGITNEIIEDADNWKDSIVLYPTEANLIMMAEKVGIDDVDLEEYETEEEKEEWITSEFEDYWDGLDDKEKVRLYNEYD